MKIDKLYIAATSQHVGKTTSTLGLVYALRKMGHDVGYCKPVGQEFVDLGNLKADKDALLFSTFMDFQLDASIHSPVILGQGATSNFLEYPDRFNYSGDIQHASNILEANHDKIVYEGTGHPEMCIRDRVCFALHLVWLFGGYYRTNRRIGFYRRFQMGCPSGVCSRCKDDWDNKRCAVHPYCYCPDW